MLFNTQALLEYLRKRPAAYLDKMQEFLIEEFAVEISKRLVFRTLEQAS